MQTIANLFLLSATPYACFWFAAPPPRSFLFHLLTITQEARYVRDEGLSFTKSRQAGCISGLLSFSNYALSYDIHEPNKSTLTLLTPIVCCLLFFQRDVRSLPRICTHPSSQVRRHAPSMAIKMHNILENETVSSERRYISRSLWMHLQSAYLYAFL